MNTKSTHSDLDLKPVHHHSYLLRIWCADQAERTCWRAILEDTHTRERFSFACLEQLFSFLMDLSESNSDQPTENNE